MNSYRETSDLIDFVAKLVEVGECSCLRCDARRVDTAIAIVGALQSQYGITPLAPRVDESANERRIS